MLLSSLPDSDLLGSASDFDFKAYLTPRYRGHFHVLVHNTEE